MRFSIKQLLIGVTLFAAFVIVAVLDGIDTGIVFAVLASFLGFTLYRLFNKWPELKLPGRIYGVTIAIAATAILCSFFVNMATNESRLRTRTARSIQRSLTNNPDFSGIKITYQERKIEYVDVSGSLKTPADLGILKKRVLESDWRGMHAIRWNVKILDTGESIDEMDYESL